MPVATENRIHIFIPANGDESQHVCDDCLASKDLEGQTEGTVPNYGDESCDLCEFTTMSNYCDCCGGDDDCVYDEDEDDE